MSNVTTIPVWKKNATACERLYELAEVAREHPERFERMVCVYAEDTELKLQVRYIFGETTSTLQGAGLLTMACDKLLMDTAR